MRRTIEFYNQEVVRTSGNDQDINNDNKKISWSCNIKKDLRQGKQYAFDADAVVTAMYRPFTKQKMYFNRRWNERVYQIPKLFPMAERNLVIIATGRGSQLPFSTMLSQEIPDLEMISKGQCFPEKVFAQPATSNQQPATSNQQPATSNSVHQNGRIVKNRLICVTGLGNKGDFSVLMVDVIPDIQLQMNGQCFPLYLYQPVEEQA